MIWTELCTEVLVVIIFKSTVCNHMGYHIRATNHVEMSRFWFIFVWLVLVLICSVVIRGCCGWCPKLLSSGDDHKACLSQADRPLALCSSYADCSSSHACLHLPIAFARAESLHQMTLWQCDHWYNCVAQESANTLEQMEGGLGWWMRARVRRVMGEKERKERRRQRWTWAGHLLLPKLKMLPESLPSNDLVK